MSDDATATYGDFTAYNCNVAAPGVVPGDYVAVVGKIQKYGIILLITNGRAGLWTAGVGDHIHLMGSAVIVKIRNLKHLSFAFHASAVPYPGRLFFLLHPVP